MQECAIWTDISLQKSEPNFLYFSTKELLDKNIEPYFQQKIIDSHFHYIAYNPRAGGRYFASRGKLLWLQKDNQLSDEDRVRLSGYIASKNLNRDTTNLENIPNIDDITTSKEKLKNTPNTNDIIEWNDWLKNLPNKPTPIEQVDLFLEGLGKLYPELGKNINLSSYNNLNSQFLSALSYLSYSQNHRDFDFVINYLRDNKYISKVKDTLSSQITLEGWKRFKEITKNLKEDSNKVFVAMRFTEDSDGQHSNLKSLYEKIQKVCEETEYKALKINDKEYNNKIDDEIISEINQSRFVVCDLTCSEKSGHRGSVYYEAGYAKGLGKEVIYTCDEKIKENLKLIAFDILTENIIFWDENDMDGFSKKLENRIKVTIK